jgi:glutamate synthase (NADPH/NADH) small chain
MTVRELPAQVTSAHPHVRVLTDRCAGCQECVIRCPTEALSMDTASWVALANSDLCVGCRQCMRTCPFSAIVVDGPLLVAPRAEPELAQLGYLLGDVSEVRSGFAGWPEALAEADRCLQCPDPTCMRGCPAHNDIPGFIAAIRDRDLGRAHDVLRRTSVLPDICSRVCNQAAQCEGACSWSLAGGTPVAIGRLERFVADMLPVPPPAPGALSGELSVGVIGSGPAGAGAAWELVEAGASVTVYEKDAAPGGLCNWGIPDFTLPQAVAARPWRQLVGAGVDLLCGTEILPQDLDRLLGTHDAVIVAHGASVPLRISVPGAELDGVTDATTFLKGAKAALGAEAPLGAKAPLGPGGGPAGFCATLGLASEDFERGRRLPKVLVLGAGNTAMDVARTARRLGLEAICVDWLDERFALTRPDELEEARVEGVDVRFSRTLTALRGEAGRVTHAELARTAQARADRRPTVVPGDPEVLSVDLVVMAMGYRVDPAFASSLPGTPVRREAGGVADRSWSASGILGRTASAFADHNSVGTLALGREIGLWSASLPVSERVWVVGDALVGPATVVEAMAQGRRAADAVLDSRPTRPARQDGVWSKRQRRVLICYESGGGKTARAAQAIAAGFSARGDTVRLLPITKVGPPELAAADVVVVGSWVEGFVVAGVRPAKAMRTWLAGLPRLGGRTAGVFCTFAIAPKGALSSMRQALEAKGAVVVAQAAFGPRELGGKAGIFGPAAFGRELARLASTAATPRVLVE